MSRRSIPPSCAKIARLRHAVQQVISERLESRIVLSADVLSYHNDAASTGQNLLETQLTPTSVNVNNFGKRYSTPVDGQVYAQPLYVSQLNVTGGSSPGVHNVVFVATEHDSLYAIDGASGAILWKDAFAYSTSSITSVPSGDVSTTDLSPEIGITSTPVIDRTRGVLFVNAKTKQIINGDTSNPHYVQTLYKVNIANGTFTSTVIGDTTKSGSTYTYNSGPYVVGSGDGATTVAGQQRVYFNALREFNRSALTLYNNNVYLGFASHGDNGPYHGWILGYNEDSLANTAAFNTTPNGGLGGIWQAGGAIAIDPQGFMYVETGNGDFDSTLNAQGFPSKGDYGDSFIKIALDSTSTQANQNGNVNGFGLKAVDYFTPFNQGALDSADTDLGSGGPLILPDSVGSAAHPHLLIGAGKEGKLYLIDRDNMGKFSSGTDHVVQEQASAINGSLDTPAFFNDGTTSRLYYVAAYGDVAKSFAISNGVLSTTASSSSTDTFAFPGSTPSISANGTNNGIVWDVDRGTNQLRAYSASNYSQELWTSALAPNNRDQLGTAIKFSVATVANGMVFVGTDGAIVAYGPPAPPTSVPGTPTSLSAVAVSGVQVNLSWNDVATNEDGYTVEQSSDGGKTYATIATLGVNATFYAALGLLPGNTYSFRVRGFNALGTSNYSNVVTAVTSSQLPALDFSSGFTGASGALKLNGSAKLNGSKLELTSSVANQTGSAFSTSTLSDQRFSSVFNFQLTNATADGFTFTLQNSTNTAVGTGGGALGYAGIAKSIAIKFDLYNNSGEGTNSTGLYLNGATPQTANGSFDLGSSGVNLHSGDVLQATIAYDGTNLTESILDKNTNATFTHLYTVNIPATIGSNTAFVGFTGGTGGASATQDILNWTYTPLPTSIPAVPTNLQVTPASGTQLNLSWAESTSQQVDGFKIYRKVGATGTYAFLTEVAGNALTYLDTALNPAVDYYYQVVASNSVGDSAPSSEAHAVTPVLPATPSGAKTTLVGSTEIDLAWTDGASNEDGYRVLRKKAVDGDNQFALVASLPANSSSYADKTVSPGTTYDYHIQSYNLAGYSDFAGVTTTTLTLPPTNVVPVPGSTSIALTWTAPVGATSYSVYRSTTSGTELAGAPLVTGLTSPAYNNLNLTNGVTYYYKVVAVDVSGASAPSDEVAATVGAASDKTAPSASLTSAPAVSVAGAATYLFTVTYADNVLIRQTSLSNSDLTVSGPAGLNFSSPATFVSSTPATNAATIVATYSVPTPGGAWDSSDNGTYSIALLASQVADTSGNFAAAAAIGSFQVAIAAPSQIAAQYNFDESTGATSSIDSSGNANTATLVGAPTFVPATHGTSSGNALSLNGNQDAFANNSASLDPTGAITLSGWINATDWNGNRRILQKGNNDTQYRLLAEDGVLKFDLTGVGTITATLPSTNAWHLITGTWNGTTMTLYVDGQSVATAAHGGAIAQTSDPLVLGAKNTTGGVAGDRFNGLLDDLRVYSTGLSAAQVSALFAAGSTPNHAPTVSVAAAAGALSADGTKIPFTVSGADADTGASTLVYTWSASGPGAVTFSPNTSNAASGTTATFSRSGAYQITATITDPGGLTVTSPVSVNVAQLTAGLAIAPASAVVANGTSQQFTAAVVDQFKLPLTTQPATITWTLLSGVGSINAASGLYQAPASGSGTASIQASASGFTSTAAITVASPATGLSARYNFDESTGATSSIDSSGNANTATLVGAPTFVPATHGTSSGNALSLNGNQDAFANNSASLDPTGAITLSGWINATDWNGNRRILQKGNNDTQYRLLAEDGVLKFDLTGVGTITATLPSTNAWHLITGTWNGTTMTLYVDGQSVATAAHGGAIAQTSDPLVLGAKNTTGGVAGDRFNGLLDDLRVYSSSLSGADVQALFAAG